MTAFEVLL
jgi:hypothetical protein